MALPKDHVLQMVAGDKFKVIVDYVDEATELPIDLTSETVISYKVYSKGTLIMTLLRASGLTVTNNIGRIQIDLTSTQTTSLDGLPDRRYVLRLDTSETTIMFGKVEVYRKV